MKKNKILLIIILILIPFVVLSFIIKTKYFLSEEKPKTNNKKEIIVKLSDKNKIKEIPLEDYIIGVVACEMPASFHIEALKAQAVASRTYTLKKINNKKYVLENSTNDQCYNSKEELKNKWDSNYKKYYSKIKNAVLLTKGEYLTYKNEIITAFYFAMSNGLTEESEMVFKEDLPYIKSVSSKWETTNKNYIRKIIYTKQDFVDKLNLKEENVNKIEIINKTNTNRVNKIKVNNTIFDGVEFRKILNLRSTDFDITIKNNNILITTKGYGHGVGMSQYGANGMAHEKKTYEEILKYFYKNVEIKNV